MSFWIIMIVAALFVLAGHHFASQKKQRELFAALFFTAWVCVTAVFIYIGWIQEARYGIAASVGCAVSYLEQAIREYRKKPENEKEKGGPL